MGVAKILRARKARACSPPHLSNPGNAPACALFIHWKLQDKHESNDISRERALYQILQVANLEKLGRWSWYVHSVIPHSLKFSRIKYFADLPNSVQKQIFADKTFVVERISAHRQKFPGIKCSRASYNPRKPRNFLTSKILGYTVHLN